MRPELDKNAEIQRKSFRGRPRGRKNSAVRPDRQEACRAVAQALVTEPAANVARLAALAWPGAQQDEKSRKAAHERTRQALNDLKRAPWLAGDAEQAEKVREALAAREAVEAAKREERARREREREEKRREREMRFRMQPARLMLQRLLRLPEIQEEFARQVRARRRFVVVGGDDTREVMRTFALGAEQVISHTPVAHFRAGMAGNMMNSAETTWRTNMELGLVRQAASLATISLEEAKHILAVLKILRQTRRKGDEAAQAQMCEELRRAVWDALAHAGWADPDLPAGQLLESQAAREAREAEAAREAWTWPVLHEENICLVDRRGMVDHVLNLTRTDTTSWPERWAGKPLTKISAFIPRLGGDEGEDEIAKLAREAAGLVQSDPTDPGPGGGRVKRGGSRTDASFRHQQLNDIGYSVIKA